MGTILGSKYKPDEDYEQLLSDFSEKPSVLLKFKQLKFIEVDEDESIGNIKYKVLTSTNLYYIVHTPNFNSKNIWNIYVKINEVYYYIDYRNNFQEIKDFIIEEHETNLKEWLEV